MDLRPTALDRAWQLGLRAGYLGARLWWRLRRPAHRGALAALWFDGALLIVRSSYKQGWSLPGGGVGRGESPAKAAEREVREEVGLHIAIGADPVVVRGNWDGRDETVHVFAVTLEQAPALRLDNRETVEARFVPPDQLGDFRFTGAATAYLQRLPATGSCGSRPRGRPSRRCR